MCTSLSGLWATQRSDCCLVHPVPADGDAPSASGQKSTVKEPQQPREVQPWPRCPSRGHFQSLIRPPVTSLLKTFGLPLRDGGQLQFCPTPMPPQGALQCQHLPVCGPQPQTTPPNPACPFPLGSQPSHGCTARGPHRTAPFHDVNSQRQEPPCSPMPKPSILNVEALKQCVTLKSAPTIKESRRVKSSFRAARLGTLQVPRCHEVPGNQRTSFRLWIWPKASW